MKPTHFFTCQAPMDDELGIARVVYIFNTEGMSGRTISDMIWIDGTPTVVLEWLDLTATPLIPKIVIPLDRRRLEKIDPMTWGADWLYQGPVDDPRE